ncbi:MAG: FliO/MopB family protein [Gammaproteobacteria bacterium]
MNFYLIKIVMIAILSLFYMSCAWSQELIEGNTLGSYSWEAIKVVISLAIVLVIFYLLVNAFKKYSGVSFKGSSSLKILGGITLGGKEKVVILEAGNVNFLIGVSSNGISKLHQFEADELKFDEENNKSSSFNQQIEKILSNK